jgi:sugar/nucleoside kinase (ribokinase family)
MEKHSEAICIGMAVTDILVRGVTAIPRQGATSTVQDISICTGGDAVNEAITLARLGHRVGLMALVGNDLQGDFVVRQCEKNGVDVSTVARTSKRPTATSIVLINEYGDRSFLSQPGTAMDEFSLDHVDLQQIRPGLKVLLVGSLFCGKSMHSEALRKVLEKAKAVGAMTVADFVSSPDTGGLESISQVLEQLDFAVPSKEEAFLYTGTEVLEQIAEEFFRFGVKNVVVKLGGEGIFVHTQTDHFRLGLYPAIAVDTTGAGDSFVAGFVSGLLRGEPVLECAKFGAATASIAIQSVGATTGVRALEQVRDVIRRHEITIY